MAEKKHYGTINEKNKESHGIRLNKGMNPGRISTKRAPDALYWFHRYETMKPINSTQVLRYGLNVTLMDAHPLSNIYD